MPEFILYPLFPVLGLLQADFAVQVVFNGLCLMYLIEKLRQDY